MIKNTIKLDPSWLNHLQDEFEQPYMKELKKKLVERTKQKAIIYPKGEEIFAALNLTPFDKVKVVILGQDPYHNVNQAHGLCFSVRKGNKIPPSLRNIFKEMKTDLNIDPAPHGDLTSWAEQGILLLNTVLTVEHGQAASHRKMGWEIFTDKIIHLLSEKREKLVFILWGRDAQSKIKLIDQSKHLILKSAHPSPLSSYRYFGNKHFSQTNAYLKKLGQNEINWALPK